MSETVERSPGLAGTPPGGPAQGSGTVGGRVLALMARQREVTVFVIAVLTFVGFAVAKSNFYEQSSLVTLFDDLFPPIIIIAAGEVMLLICGEIDLSVGFVVTFAPFLMYFLDAYYHVPGILAILISLVFGLVVGWANAFFTITLRLPSFITTLGTGFVLLGITGVTSHDQPTTIPHNVLGIGHWIGTGKWAMLIWAVIIAVIFHVLLTNTRWGLHTVAAGGNLLGAQEAGIHVNRIKYGNFMLTGLMGSIVGLQTMYYTNNIDPNAGGYTPMFFGVTAAVIGGTAMLGGSGTIIGAFFGALVIANLQEGFSIMGVSADPLNIIFGGAILIAMIVNISLARVRERGAR
ncbi:MAG TPA: ABC transporter permease [Trebonia sp.]